MDLTKIKIKMQEFVTQKGWYAKDSNKPQTPRNLAISLNLEAAELLECFQWSEEFCKSEVAEELADIILYAVQLSNVADIDLEKAVSDKLNINFDREWKNKKQTTNPKIKSDD